MTSPDLYLFCFAVGTLWTVATTFLGTMHAGHGHGHSHGHSTHAIHAVHGVGEWLALMVNPNGLAIFLSWFGGIGYLLTRHTGLAFWIDLTLSVLFGVFGACLLAAFLRFLQAHEQPLNPVDYQMIGILGRVSSPIRPDGVGELIYTRDGARRPVCARSEDGIPIGRDTEVVVTRFEKGVAYVRTWDSMLAQHHAGGSIEK